jgi:hypothetical protein
LPKLTASDLQQLVDTDQVCAISVDTSVFHRTGYNLEARTLTALAQFTARGIAHVVSDVVVREVKAHITSDLEESAGRLRSAINNFSKMRRGFDKEKAAADLGLDDDAGGEARSRWDTFAHQTSAVQLRASDTMDGDTLVSMYFDVAPPFEATGEKKMEFPDAIALLELEGYGERQGKFVLAVSHDKGWSAFAERAKWVVVVDDLAASISMFHASDAALAARTRALIQQDDTALHRQFVGALARFVDDIVLDIDADSYMDFSVDFEGAELKGEPLFELGDPSIIEAADVVTVAVDVTFHIEASASFSYFVHDSIDDDYLSMGASEEKRTLEMTAPATVTIARSVGDEEPASEVKFERLRSIYADFGHIEPHDWRDEAEE